MTPEAGRSSLSEESTEETITETFANYAASAITVPPTPATPTKMPTGSSIMAGCSSVVDAIDVDVPKVVQEQAFNDVVFLEESYSEDYGTFLSLSRYNP